MHKLGAKIGVVGAGMVIASALLYPTAASASTNGGSVHDVEGNTVRVYCNYGTNDGGTLHEAKSIFADWSWTYCPLDTDQFTVNKDVRCGYFRGPVKADGWYRIKPGTRFKIPGASLMSIYGTNKCNSSTRQWTYK